MRPPLLQRVRFRARAEQALRSLLDERGLLEVQTPSLVPNPGMEPHLTAFRVSAREAKAWDGHYLHTSPEYAVKAQLAELQHDIYALCRVFRDEPAAPWHHPEFTMLEWYRWQGDLEELKADAEAIVRAVAQACLDPGVYARSGLDRPFVRLSVAEAFERWVGAEPDAPAPELYRALTARGVSVEPHWDWETLFSVAVVDCVEANLSEAPTFLELYPAAAAALARLEPGNPRFARRFELYLPRHSGGSVELANAYDELLDAKEQRERFVKDLGIRSAAGSDAYPMPEPMLAGITRLEQSAGAALGWERLLSWLAERQFGWEPRVADWFVGV